MIFPLVLAALLGADEPIERLGKFRDRAVAEPSGLVASRRFPGIFWVHNDSGNPAQIFAVKADGTVVRSYRVAAPNLDWEDIAIDDKGHLYIADIGDNLESLPFHAIYRVDEPDPSKDPADQPLKATGFAFKYPRGKKCNAEGMVVLGDRAAVITKTRGDREPEVYVIPLDRPASPFSPLVAEKVGILPDFKKPVTGASLSGDATRLAVCSMGEVRLYSRDGEGDWKPLARLDGPPGQVEAIAWSGADLVLSNEQGVLYRITERTWRSKVRQP